MYKKLSKLFTVVIAMTLLPSMSDAQQNALDFDNVDDYITVPNASAAIVNSQNISLSCWVYPANNNIVFPDYDGICGFRNNVDADFYMIQHTATGIEARFRNSAGVAFDVVINSLTINTWQHLVLTYNGSALTLYKNGLSVGSIAASGSITSGTQTLYMGNLLYQGTNFYFKGKLDEVSLWNKALSTQEISCIYNNHIDPSDINLKMYYKFNQGTAGGNNTTITNVLNTVTGFPGSMFGFTKTGTTSNFVAGIVKGTVDSATICPGEFISFGTLTITQSGNYIQAFQTPSICDSLVELKVTVANISLSIAQNTTTLTSAQAGGTYQWIDCNNGNAPVTNATQQAFSPLTNGSYAVVITLSSCSDTSNCINFTTAGISEMNSLTASVFPNPFADQLEIRFSEIQTSAEVTVTDISGKLIYNSNNGSPEKSIKVETKDWKAGSYFIKVITPEGLMREKVIKGN
ncbi:MAG: LamG-like jellyroll fold domain-containing protein [Bacteroidota bacterium]